MQISSLRYLLALDRERHFARAARACNVSQPTLSTGIATLEAQLGQRLVARDRRFIGFTPEGEAVLPWARQVVAALDGLAQAAAETGGELAGELRLGAIPAAMPITGAFARAARQRHPALRLTLNSLASREIVNRLADFSLDAGLTYLTHELPGHLVQMPLYRERMVFVTRADASPGGPGTIGWEEALGRPLCLLHTGMQNRRILDANLAARGRAASPLVTADSYVALLALVHAGGFATIMPDSYAPLLPPWARMLAFDEPMPASVVGLVVPDRAPMSRLALAALGLGREIKTI